MTTNDWTERLSEYLDGTLAPEERSACEAWLAASDDGRALLADLRRVVAKAQMLPEAPVPESVWAGVSAGIREQPLGRPKDIVSIADRVAVRPLSVPRSRKWQFSPLQLAAAAAVLLAVGTGIGVKIRSGVTTTVARTTTTDGSVRNVGLTPVADASYDKAIQELQLLLEQNRTTLDPATVRVLEGSLAKIDAALLEAQRALDGDPRDQYLNDHLSRIKRKKLDLLRQGAALVQAS